MKTETETDNRKTEIEKPITIWFGLVFGFRFVLPTPTEQCSVRVLFGRAELSELLFRDKAKSTLLSINGALNGQTVTWDKRPYSNG